MSLRKLLGLEEFQITDAEIMTKIQQAYSNNSNEVEFYSDRKRVKVKISDCTVGVMNSHEAWGG
jgi:hypothetical protein